jgi:endonuclease YncB( thermonuclease family)
MIAMRLKLLIPISLAVVLGGIYWSQVSDRIIANITASPELSQDVEIDRVQDASHIVLKDGRTIALCGINIPSSTGNSSPGQSATQFVEALVKKSEGAYFVQSSTGNNQPTLGEITLRIPGPPTQELNLTSDLLLQGYGTVVEEAACPNIDRFKVAEERSKKQRLGLWKS